MLSATAFEIALARLMNNV